MRVGAYSIGHNILSLVLFAKVVIIVECKLKEQTQTEHNAAMSRDYFVGGSRNREESFDGLDLKSSDF